VLLFLYYTTLIFLFCFYAGFCWNVPWQGSNIHNAVGCCLHTSLVSGVSNARAAATLINCMCTIKKIHIDLRDYVYHLLRFFHLRSAETPTITGVALSREWLGTAAVTDLNNDDSCQAIIISYIYIANTVLVTFHVNGVPVTCTVLDRCAFFGGLEQSVCSSVCVIKPLCLRRNVKIVLVVHWLASLVSSWGLY
jgi:hypothetical protein